MRVIWGITRLSNPVGFLWRYGKIDVLYRLVCSVNYQCSLPDFTFFSRAIPKIVSNMGTRLNTKSYMATDRSRIPVMRRISLSVEGSARGNST